VLPGYLLSGHRRCCTGHVCTDLQALRCETACLDQVVVPTGPCAITSRWTPLLPSRTRKPFSARDTAHDQCGNGNHGPGHGFAQHQSGQHQAEERLQQLQLSDAGNAA